VRPLSAKELSEKSSESIRAHPSISTIDVDSEGISCDKRKFEFDSVFGPNSTQKEVYEKTAGDMIKNSIFKGFNATILAYGQTGSGKTFTMGTDGGMSSCGGDQELAPPLESDGVISRAVYDLFQTRNELPQGKERVKVEMSYLEIYNEQAIDLLSDDPSSTALTVRDSRTEGVIVQNLKSFVVSSPSEVQRLMEQASHKRAVGSTHMNSVSSRSHAICTLNIIIAPLESISDDNVDGPETPATPREGMKAKLTLVDLAGSERIKRTGAEGARMKEGININKGLFVLGQVVSALSELGQQMGSSRAKSNSHIPYRDSKLTRLLQDSLGGNSRTVMIACISPAESNVEESINTLRYAERTRNIKNSAVRNVVSGGLSASEAAALRRENQQLKLELAQMEAKLQSSKVDLIQAPHAHSSRGTGGLPALHNSVNIEATARLQAQCTSFLAEIDNLKEKAQLKAQEVLESSLRADKWQAKYESLVEAAREQGVKLPESADVNNHDGIVNELRSQLNECKAELEDARTDAAIARATAGAILAGKDLSSIDDISAQDESMSEGDDDDHQNEKLSTELSAVSSIIEQKEAMVQQMQKERACRDNLQFHFENSLKTLQTEVEALTTERNELMEKLNGNQDENSNNANRRKRTGIDGPTTKKMRQQITRLEERINELKKKSSEHARCIRMKEEAEKKCAKLVAEITEDKRRRAELQRKLKEQSAEMRADKKAAQLKASRMMRDSQKLKVELQKMKDIAEKQTAVLKRKIDEAAAKDRARMELEKKRRSAERMRLASSTSHDSNEINEARKEHLSTWIEREVDYSIIKAQIEDQKRQLNSAINEKRNHMKDDDTVNIQELEELEVTIKSLKNSINNLESHLKKTFPNSNLAWRFFDSETFKTLTKPDAKFVLTHVFDMCSSIKQELETIICDSESTIKSAVDVAIAKEKQLHDKETVQLKMEHAEATLNLLESTQSAVSANIMMKLNTVMDEIDPEFKAQIENMLNTYMQSCLTAGKALQSDLDQMKESQEGLQKMLDDVTQGIAVIARKPIGKAKKKVEYVDESSFDYDDLEDSYAVDSGEDSDYQPTPKGKRQNQSKKRATKNRHEESPLNEELFGESIIDTDKIEVMKVNSLKKVLKQRGLPMTGKKAVLVERLREDVKNTSLMGQNIDDSFGSTRKKVDFAETSFIGDIDDSEDPEFQPVNDTSSIPKKLWSNDDDHLKEEPNRICASTKATSPKKSPRKELTQKRKLYDVEEVKEKENMTATGITPKKHRPLGFLTSSPRLSPTRPFPFAPRHDNNRTPVSFKHTISTSKKRIIPSDPKGKITASTKKRTKKGMSDAVAKALGALDGINES